MTDHEWPMLPPPPPGALPEPTSPVPEPVEGPPTSPVPEEAASAASGRHEGPPTCPDCGAPIDPAAWYCEACGNPLIPTAPGAFRPAPAPADAPSAQTRRLGARASQVTTCRSCGGTVGADGYCQTCGAKAPSARDHFTEAPAEWVGGVCDRGIQHHRNEDAMALWADGDRAVLVVCDGVSTSIDSDVASLAAAERARDVLAGHVATGPDRGADADAVVAATLVAATIAANAAVVATTAADSTNAASATFAAAVVVGDRVHLANLGDSRVYFLGATQRQLLSLDDSMAQAFIAEGMPREEAEALPRAHAITKWLGRDAPDVVPRTATFAVPEPGWLVVCSDGLWNYASDPDDLAVQLAAATVVDADPLHLAQRLVAWANARGGHDNVTVAVARVPAPAPSGNPPAAATLAATPTDDQNGAPREHG